MSLQKLLQEFDKELPHLTAITTELAEERRIRIKEFITLAYQSAIQECLEALPEERGTKNYTNSHEAIMKSDYDFGFNSCLSQCQSNIKKLLI